VAVLEVRAGTGPRPKLVLFVRLLVGVEIALYRAASRFRLPAEMRADLLTPGKALVAQLPCAWGILVRPRADDGLGSCLDKVLIDAPNCLAGPPASALSSGR
jgi:hypothetical protein